MALSIQTNVNSLVAQQNLSVNSTFQSKTIQQLTSGYRINSSGDDAAGLAVANKFRNTISELTQGVANGNDGVAQLQIMDGGMNNISMILDRLLGMSSHGLNRPAEIEFAVRLSHDEAVPHDFGFLQLRPLVATAEHGDVEIQERRSDVLLCRSSQVLGHGTVDAMCDVVMVDIHDFERAHSVATAEAVARFNAGLNAEGRPYLLIGVGRWGSKDPWLGIPVTWDQIAGARVIVEAGFRDLHVSPSQGSHFFQNLTSFQVGYFTVNANQDADFVDWNWLESQPAAETRGAVRRLRFDQPLVARMNGKSNQGVIYKPGAAIE